MAGQQTELDANDDLLELHKAGGKHKIISIKIILGLHGNLMIKCRIQFEIKTPTFTSLCTGV